MTITLTSFAPKDIKIYAFILQRINQSIAFSNLHWYFKNGKAAGILLSWSKVLIFQIYICFLNLCLQWETISCRVSYVHVPYILHVEHKLSIVNVRTFINANSKSVSVNILLLTRRGISLCISIILKKHKFFTHDDDGDSKITWSTFFFLFQC